MSASSLGVKKAYIQVLSNDIPGLCIYVINLYCLDFVIHLFHESVF